MKGAIFTMGSKLPPPCDQAQCFGDGLNTCHFCEGLYCDDHFEDDGKHMCWHCAGGDEGNYNGPT